MRLRSSVVRPRAAGASWTSRTSSAAWAVRSQHTSVIDATGAIYVIGGSAKGGFFSSYTYLNDVWASTNGGADRTQGRARTHTHGRAHAVCSYSCTGGMCTLAATGGRTRVRLRSSVVRPRAAGASWTSRTSSAAWAVRSGHTSVIDVTGAIYVIGGLSTNYFKDVWASTPAPTSTYARGVCIISRHAVGSRAHAHACTMAYYGTRAHASHAHSHGRLRIVPCVVCACRPTPAPTFTPTPAPTSTPSTATPSTATPSTATPTTATPTTATPR